MNAFLSQLRHSNEPLYYFGLGCLVAALLCLVLIQFTHTQVLGVNAWYKPMKFFLATGIFVWTMAWYMQYLGNNRAVVWYSWGLIVLFTFEDGYIAWQAARGQLSHFNVSTPLYSTLYGLMAVAAVGISLWTAYIALLFFQQDLPDLSGAYLWGIRLGLLLFIVFSMQGLSMGARLTHTIGGADGSPGLPVVNWSRRYGDLRIAHFLGMHALQILPLLSFYVLKSVRATVIAGLLYAILTTFVFWQAMQGRPLLR
ncbi:hypothetical protein BN8_01988 [Fibrisoma limi BUZ 3]|uniref:DUF1295 domain-containing protein n=1 Tax=Fibrisoma limi BUZ 3 TaxID=1185876 RepID=I2GGB8_9BACT|nr:hypothetical protein [Fibrisoma limi]CCH52943.1 hypothetical protein BN8_01988 [Fibrisoma limi BUZ 3]